MSKTKNNIADIKKNIKVRNNYQNKKLNISGPDDIEYRKKNHQ